MTVEYTKLASQIRKAANVIVTHMAEMQQLASEANTTLEQIEMDNDQLRAQVELARDQLRDAWRGAIPSDEPIALSFDLPDALPPAYIIASDGSQVHPDRHAIAQYALINIGTICEQSGSGLAPEVSYEPRLLVGNDLLDPETEEIMDRSGISLLRDKRELSRLIELASDLDGTAMAMIDAPLLMWTLSQRNPPADLFEWFEKQLFNARRDHTALVGYVDKPGSRGVLALLSIASIPPNEADFNVEILKKYRNLPDRIIFAQRLLSGQRSAFFYSDSPINRDLNHLAIAFFYLNVGGDTNPIIARVEIPKWVAQDKALLDSIHAEIYRQSQTLEGYPYLLARAHEIAVVTRKDGEEIERLLGTELLEHGIIATTSSKAQSKKLIE